MPDVRPHHQQAGATPVQAARSTEALLAGVLAAAKAALPEGLDLLVWGAARVGDHATLRHLLSIGGCSSWSPSKDNERWGRDTCLGVASRFGHEGAMKELVESGVNVDEVRTDNGVTALFLAAQEGHEGAVEQLLKAGADVNNAKTDDGVTPLWIAAQEGHEGVVNQLLKAGADVDKAKTDGGATTLLIAAEEGHEGVVEQLLKAGADVDKAKTNSGATPLSMAAYRGHDRVVEQLLKAGADVNKAWTDGGATPLLIAAEEGHEGVVEKLLKAGADVNKTATDVGATPLYMAAWNGHERVTEQLLKAGADVNRATTYDGETPLYMAADEGHVGVVEKLLKAGADVNTEINPLIVASHSGHSGVCSLLLKAGANANLSDFDGSTALDTAVAYRYRDVALVLMEHGASSSDETMTPEMLKILNKWLTEALQENKRAMAEKDRQMEEVVQGIPEWCAQAASAVIADEGKNDGRGSSPHAQVQPGGVGRKRKVPSAAEYTPPCEASGVYQPASSNLKMDGLPM